MVRGGSDFTLARYLYILQLLFRQIQEKVSHTLHKHSTYLFIKLTTTTRTVFLVVVQIFVSNDPFRGTPETQENIN